MGLTYVEGRVQGTNGKQEIIGLVLNPFNRTLQPMRMMLA